MILDLQHQRASSEHQPLLDDLPTFPTKAPEAFIPWDGGSVIPLLRPSSEHILIVRAPGAGGMAEPPSTLLSAFRS